MPLIYTREITDDEITALEHLVPDVTAWIDTAISEKIANCKKRMVREYIDKAIENNLPLPSTADDIVAAVVSHPDYMTQKERDEAGAPGLAPIDITPVQVDPAPTPPITNGNDQPA